jgi:hypothetical protein
MIGWHLRDVPVSADRITNRTGRAAISSANDDWTAAAGVVGSALLLLLLLLADEDVLEAVLGLDAGFDSATVPPSALLAELDAIVADDTSLHGIRGMPVLALLLPPPDAALAMVALPTLVLCAERAADEATL